MAETLADFSSFLPVLPHATDPPPNNYVYVSRFTFHSKPSTNGMIYAQTEAWHLPSRRKYLLQNANPVLITHIKNQKSKIPLWGNYPSFYLCAPRVV